MSRPTRFQIAKSDIVRTFADHPQRVFGRAELAQILEENRQSWRLAQGTTLNNFIEVMLEKTDLQAVKLEFPRRTVYRYTWGPVPRLEVVQSLKPEGYFTHYTAMHLHGLTDQIPKTIYLNFEQRASGGGGQLAQDRIDRAFKRKCRISKKVATFGDQRVQLLNGQNTGQLGVIEVETSDNSRLRMTNIERTLIDATVRPVYSGGVFQVLQAFEMARDRVSVNKLVATLQKLNFTYPYHQAIGFYLERAGGYRESQVSLLRQFDITYDFYLTHEINQTRYDEKWRLFVPKEL